jgi:hypothetical protein
MRRISKYLQQDSSSNKISRKKAKRSKIKNLKQRKRRKSQRILAAENALL